MSDKQYYAMIDGQRRGPLSADELIEHGTVASTPIWCDGMADWTTASQVDAISTRLSAIPQPPVYRGIPTVDAMANGAVPPPPATSMPHESRYYVSLNGVRSGPYTLAELSQKGLTSQTPVWMEGMPNWVPAEKVPALATAWSSPKPSVAGGKATPTIEPDASPQLPPHSPSTVKFTIGTIIGLGVTSVIFARPYIWPTQFAWRFDNLPVSVAWRLLLLALMLMARWKHPSMANGFRLGVFITLVGMLVLALRMA